MEARQLGHVFPADAVARLRGLTGSLGALGVGLLLAFAAEVIFFTIRSPYFFDAANFKNIGRAIAIIGIAAVGETIVIIAGGFDLSVGSTMAAAGMISGYLVNHGTSVWLAFLTALALGLGIGLGNGAIVSYARINPLIDQPSGELFEPPIDLALDERRGNLKRNPRGELLLVQLDPLQASRRQLAGAVDGPLASRTRLTCFALRRSIRASRNDRVRSDL